MTVLSLLHQVRRLYSPNVALTSKFFPAVSLPSVYQCVCLSSVFLLQTHTHIYPLKFPFGGAVSSRALCSPGCRRAVSRLIYALSSNLSALFVPLDHTASTQTNPAFVQGSLIYSDQNCTLHHKRLQDMTENTQISCLEIFSNIHFQQWAFALCLIVFLI